MSEGLKNFLSPWLKIEFNKLNDIRANFNPEYLSKLVNGLNYQKAECRE